MRGTIVHYLLKLTVTSIPTPIGKLSITQSIRRVNQCLGSSCTLTVCPWKCVLYLIPIHTRQTWQIGENEESDKWDLEGPKNVEFLKGQILFEAVRSCSGMWDLNSMCSFKLVCSDFRCGKEKYFKIYSQKKTSE